MSESKIYLYFFVQFVEELIIIAALIILKVDGHADRYDCSKYPP